MGLLYVSKGNYLAQPQDILDTLAGAVFADGNIRWKSGTNFYGILDHNNTVNQTYFFPNATGTIPLLQTANTWLSNNTFQAITHFKVAIAGISNVIDITANGVLTNGQFTGFVLGNSATNNNSFQFSYVHNTNSNLRYLSIGPFESLIGGGCLNFYANNLVQFVVGSTGAGSASLGSNSPASILGSPYTWIKMIAPDGTLVYVPAWKA